MMQYKGTLSSHQLGYSNVVFKDQHANELVQNEERHVLQPPGQQQEETKLQMVRLPLLGFIAEAVLALNPNRHAKVMSGLLLCSRRSLELWGRGDEVLEKADELKESNGAAWSDWSSVPHPKVRTHWVAKTPLTLLYNTSATWSYRLWTVF